MKRQYLLLILVVFSYGQNSVKLPDYLQPESVKKYNVDMAFRLTSDLYGVNHISYPFIIFPGLIKMITTKKYYEQKFDQFVVERSFVDTSIYDPNTGFIISSSHGGRWGTKYLFQYDNINNQIIKNSFSNNELKYKSIYSFSTNEVTLKRYDEESSGFIDKYIFDKKGVLLKELTYDSEHENPIPKTPEYNQFYQPIKLNKFLRRYKIQHSFSFDGGRNIISFKEWEDDIRTHEIIYKDGLIESYICRIKEKAKDEFGNELYNMINSYEETNYEYIFVDK